ncbi:MAG: HDIG domain-containing protein [Myxococcota bacterium]|nr:HDIG domain-containing protein [Myxococcota bacterium]
MQDPPSRTQCLALIEKYGMLPNIRAHSLKVCEVSLAIARAVVAAGFDVDCQLVEAGALLHDITKTRGLETRENHARTGYELLLALGYPQTAAIVQEHIIPEDRGDNLTPAEIVAYADKRVLHDRIVSIEERFDYLRDTYGKFPEAKKYYAMMLRRMRAIESVVEQITGAPLEAAMPRS